MMRKETSLPVRLSPDDKIRLRVATDRLGLTPSLLIRLLVHSFVEDYDRKGGRIVLPLSWRGGKVAKQPSTKKALKAAGSGAIKKKAKSKK